MMIVLPRCLARPLALGAAVLLTSLPSLSAEPVYSGPQPGERITPFRVLEIPGTEEGRERDPVADNAGKVLSLVFVHGLERSLVPLLRAVDQYGAEHRDRLATEVVFLAADRLEGERRVRAATGSLRLQARTGLSLDGAEGPGNYGLNRECLMTLVAAKDGVVLTNFALVQPGIADAPAVLPALAQVSGSPTPVDVDRFTRAPGGRMESDRPAAGRAGDAFPGAVPTDPRLNTLLRQFLRPTNDVATVDRLLGDMERHITGQPDLIRQAIDGWTRILHFGDRYGTEHAREVARVSLEKLKKSSGDATP